jgi:hypothetical protein
MESKPTDHQAKPEEIIIRLTEKQREQIKGRTGHLVTELKIQQVEGRANPVAMPFQMP